MGNLLLILFTHQTLIDCSHSVLNGTSILYRSRINRQRRSNVRSQLFTLVEEESENDKSEDINKQNYSLQKSKSSYNLLAYLDEDSDDAVDKNLGSQNYILQRSKPIMDLSKQDDEYLDCYQSNEKEKNTKIDNIDNEEIDHSYKFKFIKNDLTSSDQNTCNKNTIFTDSKSDEVKGCGMISKKL